MSHTPIPRTSRRSHTNLHHLSLAPLSNTASKPSGDRRLYLYDSDSELENQYGHQSYIAGKSAPTTPGILSRSTSHARVGSQSYTHLAFADESYNDTSSNFGPGYGTDPRRSMAGNRSQPQTPGAKKKRRNIRLAAVSAGAPGTASPQLQQTQSMYGGAADSSEWLLRAGAAITSDARESKGQSWLTTRASSTSLVAQHDDDLTPTAYGRRSVDEDRMSSSRGSRNPSRPQSRAHSRAPSALASRRGSRSETNKLEFGLSTPGLSRATQAGPGGVKGDYFGTIDDKHFAGPDFVDADAEDEDDDSEDSYNADLEEQREAARLEEEEVARLTRERGFGLGSIVDRVLSSTLFSVREDGEDTEDEDAILEAAREKREREGRPGRADPARELVKTKSAPATVAFDVPTDGKQGQGGWKDAAWLLSVASKVMF